MTLQKSIEVNPQVGEFSDIECGKIFVIPFSLCNVGTKMCKIRCVPPKAKCFRLISAQQSVAPGMKHIIELEYSSTTPAEIHDEFIIRTENEEIRIPIHAWFPTPNLQISSNVDFGHVSANNPVESKKIKLTNSGRKDGNFQFVADGVINGVSVTPSQGIVPAGRDIDVSVHLFPTELGPIYSVFFLHVEGKATAKMFTVSATVLEGRVMIIRPDTNENISQLNFGKIFYGQKREVQLLIRNTGQNSVSYSIASHDAEPEEDGIAFSLPIQILPREGRISPNSYSTLDFIFAPRLKERKQGWSHIDVDEKALTRHWEVSFEVDILETEQKIGMQLSGVAIPIIVNFSESHCAFGECPTNCNLDSMITLESKNIDLPVLFQFNRVAHFVANPSRGIINPKNLVNIKITFHPRQLGSFEEQFIVSLNNGIKKIHLNVSGSSKTIANKPEMPKITNGVPEDFIRPIKLVANESRDLTRRINDNISFEASSTNVSPEYENKMKHNNAYNNYLLYSRLIRKTKQDAKKVLPDNPSDLDMTPAMGLEPPEPVLPKSIDRFILPCFGYKNMQMDMTSIHKIKFDEHKFVKKVFRKDPSNLNEMRECKLVLSPKNIHNINIPFKLIDFGRVSIFSVNTKPFFVQNGLKTHIYIAISFSREELSQSTPCAQVIPPGQTACFDIKFRSEIAQTFQQGIYFTINETHKLKFVVIAEVVPSELYISNEELTFQFSEFDSNSSVFHTVNLSNPGNSETGFNWVVQSDAFLFSPSVGVVPASGSLPITVSYAPILGVNESRAEAELHVSGGSEIKRLQLFGFVQTSSCSWSVKEAKIDLKKISIGVIRTHILTLKNTSNVVTVFAFDTSLLIPGISLSSVRGCIAPNATQAITISLKITEPRIIKCQLHCNVRGMKQLLRALITAECKVPEIDIIEPPIQPVGEVETDIDFGGVYVGSSEYRGMSIVNNDEISASVIIDFSYYHQFSIAYLDKRIVQNTLSSEDIDLPIKEGGDIHIIKSEMEENDDQNNRGYIYRLTIAPKSLLSFYILFSPTEIFLENSFKLPISFAGCNFNKSLRPISINAGGKRPKLLITPNIVDFGACVVFRDNTSKVPNHIALKISNETENVISWELIGNNAKDSEFFRVEPTNGKLQAGQISHLQITFVPVEIKPYSERFSIYLDNNKADKYTDIVLKGFGTNPSLFFDRREIILPPVPLNISVIETFYIGNEGYDSFELKYRIPGEGKIPVQLNFPEGNIISSTGLLPVEVHFVSKKTMTFTVNIDFYDETDDNLFAIPLTCTADNSLLTTAGYVKNVESQSTLQAENDKKPIIFVDNTRGFLKAHKADDEVGDSFFSLDTTIDKVFNNKELERVRLWLISTLLPDPIEDLISALQSNQCKLFLDIIEMLFGKPPPLPKVSSREGPLAIIDFYDSLLLFLKQYGACVSEVRSEFLMKYEDYIKVVSHQEPMVIKIGKIRQKARLSESRFFHRSLHAWLLLLVQTIRIFFVSRINWKTLRGLPPTTAISAFASQEKWSVSIDSSCVGSNLYSQSESVLLKWLSVHLSFFFPKNEIVNSINDKNFDVEENKLRLTNFDINLRDSKAFASVIMAYIPGSIERLDPSKISGIVANPNSKEEMDHNANILLNTMYDFGIDLKLTSRDIIEGSSIDNILLASFLFNTLPQYIPKAKIKFKGKLHEKITKQVELSNPTKWPIDYTVAIFGNSEFKSTDTKISVKPKSTTIVSLFIIPKFSKKVEGICMFLSSRGSATIVFNLETEIDPDSVIKTIEGIEAPLYEPVNYELIIDNPFQYAGTFSVHIYQEYVKDKDAPEEESIALFPEAFWSASDALSLKRNDKAKFILQFLPCVRGWYKARVVFRDDKIGDFAYRIIAKGLPPKPYDTIKIQTEAAVPLVYEITIPTKHAALEKALAQRLERLKLFKGVKKNQIKEQVNEVKEVCYNIEYLGENFTGPNPFFTGPKTFFFTNNTEKKSNKAKNAQVIGQSFSLTFSPKIPGIYNLLIVLSSSWDVRVLSIEAKSRSPGMKAELEFYCHARQQIVQEIPITNASEMDWTISATLQGEYFSGPREIRVVAGKTKNYPLVFFPLWICDVQGQLILKNTDTLEKYTYALVARADEPLAESTINIECRAREVKKMMLTVPNITKEDVNYEVVTDLPFISGDASLSVSRMESGRYTLVVNPQLNGKVTGSLKFFTPNKRFVWFVIQTNVSRPLPEDTITISTVVRVGAVAEITIKNPKNKPVDFIVRRQGDELLGEDILTINANSSEIYQLIYLPNIVGERDGTVSFYNDDIGEFWYQLKLISKEAPPNELNFSCEIGKTVSTEITINNPLDIDCNLSTKSSNNLNFSVSPINLRMNPLGSVNAVITYTPSAIQLIQEGTIIFSHPRAGTWVFNCKGFGQPPVRMNPIQCFGQINTSSSTSIIFKNPFPNTIKYSIKLIGDVNVFTLMHKKQTVLIDAFQQLQIPIAYNPKEITENYCTVVIESIDQAEGAALCWEFPIEGIAEYYSSTLTRFSCRSRQKSNQIIPFELPNINIIPAKDLTTEIKIDRSAKYFMAASSSISVRIVDSPNETSLVSPDNIENIVFCEFTYAPLRPFTAAAELLIKREDGGLWRFPLHLESLSPDVDDVFYLEADVNVVAQATFTLYNVLPQPKPFVAYFTSDSPKEFSVTPSKGILPPMSRGKGDAPVQGAEITINFLYSIQYGKTLIGCLVIDTEEMQWRYKVHGALPKYKPPTNVKSVVMDNLKKIK